MFKKTLLALAVASSVGLTGCLDDGSSGKNANPDYKISNPDFDGKTWPIFNPLTSELPIPNDLIFDSKQADGTFGVTDSTPPVTTALNELSGASTVAPAVIQFNGLIDPATVAINQTVFLIELTYASGDPVRALSIGEPPTVNPAEQPSVRADVETLDGQSAIRILPLEPLDPRKRYIAVVTNDVKDINGDSIVASPTYQSLTDAEQPLGNAALAPVKTLINSLWEPLVLAATQGAITEDKIAISYSFTTSNDEKVLPYIAEPAAWFSDQIASFIKISAAKAALAAGAKDYATVNTTVTGAVSQFPTAEQKVAFAPIFDAAPPAGCNGLTAQMAFDCAGTALAGSFDSLLPTPTGRGAADFTFAAGAAQPAPLVSAVVAPILTANGAASTDVLVAQGTVNLPYYLGTSAPGVVTDSWKADSGLAAGLNDQFKDIGLVIPQADPSVSTAVNYNFPFPKKQADVDVPVLVILPTPGGGVTSNGKVVIYQHGITTDRSAALTFGTALAANGFTVVAIDQPLHGIGAFTAEEQDALAGQLLTAAGNPAIPNDATTREALINGTLAIGVTAQLVPTDPATAAGIVNDVKTGGTSGDPTLDATILSIVSLENTVANAGSTVPGIAPMIGDERHFGLYAPAPSQPAPIDYAAGTGDSGSLFINLTSFLTTRDNMRESTVDQINLRASLAAGVEIATGINIPAATNTNTYFVGHSLGTITGTPFVASINANQTAGVNPAVASNDIAAASMLTPGGGVVRLLENSPSFAPRILLGLQQSAGLEQGDANLETYFNVFQATIDTADPINFVDNLTASGTPVLFSEVEGDTVIPNAADLAQWGVGPLDATIPASVTGLPVSVTVDSFNAPLAGTDPLSLGFANGVDDPLFSKYLQADYPAGTGESALSHGTPVSASPAAAFGQMVMETIGTFTPVP
ncbi:hypothetical protein [Marinobacter sp. BGYM27]|uniref:hypothetical protein n=1 Tax=Marinobacter sp. BGYM27 TaxID=2975597 RepID=UPI0021A80D1A|nr:hypothetical protein [Marinobacter sp. BGYM27]MDG5498726.1 hypothetical protein [Marinobacter sp. BGYM27]